MERIVDTQQAITVVIRPCRSCGGGIPETDRFCRLCGQSQQAGQTIAVGPELRESLRKDLQEDLREARGGAWSERESESGIVRRQGAASGPTMGRAEARGGGGSEFDFGSGIVGRRAGSGPVTDGSGSSVSAALVTRLSDQLVSGSVACVFNVAGGRAASADANRVKRIVSLLVSVPVWLIIVVLSPFDAYATARLITDARWQQERI